MIYPVACLGVGIVVVALFQLIFGHWGYGVVPGIFAAGGALWYLARKVLQDVNRRMMRVQEILTPKNPTARGPMAQTKPRFDDAIVVLRDGLKWKRYLPFVAPQIESQIGTLYYLDKRWDDAERHLKIGTMRNWVGMAMLASIHYRRKRYDEMKAAFEKAARWSPREALLWNLWAWLLNGQGDRDGAIAVLVRGLAFVKNDERTKRNLESLQNGGGVKLRSWDMMWYQFHFEVPQMQAPQAQFSRRATARGR